MFLVNSLHDCTFKSSFHEINARKRIQLNKPTNCVSYKRGMSYASIKKFNALPTSITNQVMNKKCFVKKWKTFLLDKPLYSSEEYFNLCAWDEDWGCAYYVLYEIYSIIVNFIKLYCHACLYGEI